jgi:predicted TIM-barrel fold metal-dependent hydrolase
LCRRYLTNPKWIGVRFHCPHDSDALNIGGGPELLNALRRYGKPILVSIGTAHALNAAIDAARSLPGLRFLISPEGEDLVGDALPTMSQVLNTSLVPIAAFVERDLIAHAAHTLGERGERRILWASDWGRFHPGAALGVLRDAQLSAPDRERIAYRNALELLP